MELSPGSVSLVAPVLENLKPTTEEDYPRFRILIVGRSGVGKSSLINAIFKASLANVEHDRAGAANINKGITSPYNKHLILHDSQGYEPGDKEKFNILENFITEQTKKQSPTERLHAIWLCIPASYSGGRVFETGEENIFKLNRNKVPIVVVITKFDLYIAGLSKRGKLKGPNISQAAEQMFEQTFGHKFKKGGVSQDRPIPYALVSKSRSDTLQRLVQVTMEHIGAESSSLTSGLPGSDENQSGSAQIALATAQRVDMAGKIEASIKVGKRKYWRAIASSMVFLNVSLENCLYAIHKDIITIWNFRDLHEFLLSDGFRRRVMVIVEDLKDTNTMQSKVTVASALAGLSKLWTNAVYKNGPEHIRCLMGYVVDLTLILQAMFQVSLQDQYEGTVTVDHVDEILYEFHSSEKKKNIHHAIRTFAQHSRAKDDVVEKIQLLLKENQMTKADTQLNKNRPPLLSLLTILRFELTANGLVVNQIILGLVCELLKLPDFRSIVPGMDPLDVELLLDFILYLLQNDHLLTCGVPDANRKARRLMAKLISEANVIPQSLYITNVSFDADHSPIGIGGHGRVLKGIYEGRVVALKMLDNFNKQTDLFQELCKEALVWRSLRHDFILPLLGIFKEQKLQFLVSPLMPNGTLMDWRRNIKLPSSAELAEIHRLILEVAEGVQYLHLEGIVHGDIKGDNVLLDSQLHCKIVDFGLTRHSDATATGTLAYTPHYAAPELFGKCSECSKPQCNGCRGKPEVQKKTTGTDVYAFGCLYYAIFFSSVPYEGELPFRIGWLVTTGERPQRLEKPKMQESLWNLINDCWKFHAADRPPMHRIVEMVQSFITPA
ncbi:kinase-like domain-containing protein [Amanita rubescens]|nr:kinase-like domain-containing protein [Amanita rubescens]